MPEGCFLDARLRAIGQLGASGSLHGDGPGSVTWSGGPPASEFGSHYVHIRPTANRRDFEIAGFGASGMDLATLAAQTVSPRVFRDRAERLNIGRSPNGRDRILQPDARNLPGVLSNLQANPHQFQEYVDLVRQVFPQAEAITLPPCDPQQVEIRVWQLPLRTRRDDLAFPLDQCGTGFGQVLAILYVIVASQDPQIILIDEPNSFLHPGAARSLVQVLRQFPQHQYVIATHAPEVIAEAGSCPVIRVDWSDGASHCEVFAERTTVVSRQLLSDVGARLSDVFGFDQVLWVEGPSDRDCFSAILEKTPNSLTGLALLPVRDTGNFERRKARDIVAIYAQASMGSALVPPTLGFLLDREGRSEKEREDIARETSNRVSFLERRMLENYLLDLLAIADVINQGASDGTAQVVAANVENWVLSHGNEAQYGAAASQPLSKEWRAEVQGGRLLRNLFSDLSDARIEFQKTRHCVALVRSLLTRDPAFLDPLKSELLGPVRNFVCEPVDKLYSLSANRSPNWMASCALAACHEIGGFFHFSVISRSANQMSLSAA